jgi:glycosyltransferase involved in cell wall biosynthesis
VITDVVPWPNGPRASQEHVAVVTVSYNTRQLTAFLLWSLHRILRWPTVEIVVVDNGSQDGSAELLAEVQQAGVCVLLANDVNCHHGPGLNQGISWLAARAGPPPPWIWILDSDAVVARPDALSSALDAAKTASAAVVGEPQWDRWHQVERFELYSLLLDPAQVWRRGIEPFTEGGDPSFELLRSAAALGLRAATFPFAAKEYLIHRGRGSLAAVVAAGDESHPLYSWATEHHEPHFADVPGAEQRYFALLRSFRAETGALTGASLAAACKRRPADPQFQPPLRQPPWIKGLAWR